MCENIFSNEMIGERLIKAREDKGYTQDDVASALGVKRELVSFWEHGKRELKAGYLIELSKCLGVSADYILGLRETKSTDVDVQAAATYLGTSDDVVDGIKDILHYAKFREIGLFVNENIRCVEEILSHPSSVLLFADLVNIVLCERARQLDDYMRPYLLHNWKRKNLDIPPFDMVDDLDYFTYRNNQRVNQHCKEIALDMPYIPTEEEKELLATVGTSQVYYRNIMCLIGDAPYQIKEESDIDG